MSGSLLSRRPDAVLDLHGLSTGSATSRTRGFVQAQASLGPGRLLHVITGKGTGAVRSAVGRMLGGELRPWVAEHRPDLSGGGWIVRLR